MIGKRATLPLPQQPKIVVSRCFLFLFFFSSCSSRSSVVFGRFDWRWSVRPVRVRSYSVCKRNECIAPFGVKLECHTKTLHSRVACRCTAHRHKLSTRCPFSSLPVSRLAVSQSRASRRTGDDGGGGGVHVQCSYVICLSIRYVVGVRTIFRLHAEVI